MIRPRNCLLSIGLLIAAFDIVTLAHSQQAERMLVRITPSYKAELDKLSDLDLDFAYRGLKDYVDVIVDQTELDEIAARGLGYELLPALTKASLYDPEYHTYEEVVHELDSLHQVYPTITAIYQIGASQQYQIPIYAIKISDNAAEDEDEFTVNYDGLHHAREPMGTETCMVLINFLLSNYGTDPQITEIIDNMEIWITPILNSEGYKYLVDNDLSSPWWRKNQRDNNENGVFDPDYDGVDLNRNYDYRFAEGGSPNPGSWTYRGPYPFSESEVAAKRDLVLRERFLCSISYHSYAEEVYYVRGLEGVSLPETPLLDAFAEGVATRIPKLSGIGHYEPGGGYASTNMSYPWCFAVAGVYEVLVEVGTEHIPPGPVAIGAAWDNLFGAMYPLEKTIAGPGIIGHVTDAVTGAPVEAEVKILEYYRPSMTPRKSEAGYGRFHRFAAPGTYTVEASAPSYVRKTVNNVVVSQSGWTEVEIPLDWGATPVVDTFFVDDDSSGMSLGNGNGLANISETVELQLVLRNIGNGDADSVAATLISLNQYATVTQNRQEFGAIPIDSTATSQGEFVFTVDHRVPDGFALPFRLQISGAGGLYWEDEFSVAVAAPVLDYSRVVVHDSLGNSNGALEPGETAGFEVIVANNGHMDATLVHAYLTSYGSLVNVIDCIDSASVIGAGEEASVVFEVELSESAPDPYIADFALGLLSSEKYVRTQTFRLACLAGFFDNLEYGENGWWHEVRGNPPNSHDDWQLGTPLGDADGQDPSAAFSGSNVWGNDLGGEGWNGYYQHNVNCYLNSPVIDCSRYSNVGLKFMRWLNVRAGDVASILVNDQVVWTSPANGQYDHMWWEQMVDISSVADGNPAVVISFGLTSNDDSYWGGGWNIDDVMVRDQLMSKVGPEVNGQTPDEWYLFQNYPNPFNSTTAIRYQLPTDGRVGLRVYNLLGQAVRVLLDKDKKAGQGTATWDGKDSAGRDVASGIYLVYFEVKPRDGASVYRQIRKMMLVR